MHFTTAEAALAAAVPAIGEAQPRCGDTKVVAIDGPSGAGKTDFTTALAQQLPGAALLHMDDLYPGWDGLRLAVADLYSLVLVPLARGESAAYRGWDWTRDRYDGWHVIPPAQLLLVEGVGSGAWPGAELESVLIWLEAEGTVRFRRGIERDGDPYLLRWQRWAALEEALFADDLTRERADLLIDTTP
jgi:hypothetical protein